MGHICVDLPNMNNKWIEFGLANINMFFIHIRFGLTNIDMIHILIQYEHNRLT